MYIFAILSQWIYVTISPEESYKDFKRIWNNYYGWLPDIHKAKKYSGNDRAEEWLNNVLYFYNTWI